MAVHRDIPGTVFAGNTRQLRDRIVGDNDVAIVRADVSSISYTIDEDHSDPSQRAAVTGHDGVSLTVNDVIFNSLQTPESWTENIDATGYNFAFTPDISVNAAFPNAGRFYLVTVTLVMASGQPIVTRFRLQAL